MDKESLNDHLRAAILAADVELTAKLLQDGADPNAKANLGEQRMLEFAIHNQRVPIAICRLLLDSGARANPALGCGDPLSAAAMRGSAELCEELIQQGAQVNRLTSSGMTALHAAAATGNAQVCNLLIDKGADIHRRSKEGLTPLHMAVRFWHGRGGMDTIKLLVDKGASPSFTPERPPSEYLTPFQMAVWDAGVPAVKYFIEECGEDPFQLTLDGSSMIELAVKPEISAYMRMLLTERAISAPIDATATAGNGQSPNSPKPKIL